MNSNKEDGTIGKKNDFFMDGAFDINRYQEAPIHIVWLLKEALQYNFTCQKECFEDACSKKSLGPTWQLMAYVAYGIQKMKNGKYPSWGEVPLNFQEPTGSAEYLKNTAAVNVKKIPNERDNGHSANSEILESFRKNKDFIFKQLDELNPHILIFGYPEMLSPIVDEVYHHFEGESFLIRESQDSIGSIAVKISKSKSRVYLWGYHPEYYKGEENQCSYYNDILQAVSRFYKP